MNAASSAPASEDAPDPAHAAGPAHAARPAPATEDARPTGTAALSPAALAYLQETARRTPVPTDQLPLQQARAQASAAEWKQRPPQPVARTLDTFAPSPTAEVPLRIHWPLGGEPEAAPLPALLMLPGGGWVTGNADLADSASRAIANAAGCAVVIVTPQKAPEHPFPVPLTDCLAAYAWVTEHAAGLGLDPLRVGLAGDSAGGNLALATALALRDRTEFEIPAPAAGTHAPFGWAAPEAPSPTALALVYPVTDAGQDTASYADFGAGCGLTAERMAFYWDCYAPGEERSSPLASVGRAELGGLPPTLLATAGADVLRDEDLALADRLRAAGVPVTQWDFPGTPHGFLHADGVLREGADLVDGIGAWAGEVLRG